MKKLFAVSSVLVLLASCTGAQTKDDFNSLYDANLKTQIESTKNLLSVAYGKQQEVTGQMSFNTEIAAPNIEGKVTGSTNYTAITGGSQDQQVAFESPKITFDGKGLQEQINASGVSTGIKEIPANFEVSADVVELFNKLTSFVQYKNIDIKGKINDSEMQKEFDKNVADVLTVLKKFEGKWIALNHTLDKRSLQLIERLQIFENFDKYLTDNRVFSPIGDAVKDGTKRTYNITLNKESIVNIIQSVIKDVRVEDLTAEDKSQINEAVDSLTLTGTVTYDLTNPKYQATNLQVGTKEMADRFVVVHSEKDGKDMNMTLAFVRSYDNEYQGQAKITLSSHTENKKTSFSGSLATANSLEDKTTDLEQALSKISLEQAKFSGDLNDFVLENFHLSALQIAHLDYEKDKSLTANVTIPIYGSFNLSHKINSDSSSGSISVSGTNIAEWAYTLKNKALASLSFSLNKSLKQFIPIELESVNLKLEPTSASDMLSGKFEVKTSALYNNNIDTYTADIGLQAEPTKFGLTIHNVLRNGNDFDFPMKSFEFFATTQTPHDVNKKLKYPENPVTISEINEAIEVVTQNDNADIIEDTTDTSTLEVHTGVVEASH